MKVLIWLSLICQTAVAFAPTAFVQQTRSTGQLSAFRPAHDILEQQEQQQQEVNAEIGAVFKGVTGIATGWAAFAGSAFAGEEIEMAELPPPWVPAVFAVVLLIGVGVLTGSLGDVMDEEASLGLQSGARARKEIERSKSSYFKKR